MIISWVLVIKLGANTLSCKKMQCTLVVIDL